MSGCCAERRHKEQIQPLDDYQDLGDDNLSDMSTLSKSSRIMDKHNEVRDCLS